MKNLERRVVKLEGVVERNLAPRGRLSASDEIRVYLHKFMEIPGYEDLARECCELHMNKIPLDAPEWEDYRRRSQAAWLKHYGSEESCGEVIESWRALPDTHARVMSSARRPLTS